MLVDLSLDRVIYALRAVDLDPDARLYYSIVSINCLSVLGQPLDDDCRTLVQFGNRGVRNGSLILTADPRRTDEDVDGHRGDISDIVQFVRRKTRAIASAFVNVSVADLNHPLEPSENGNAVIFTCFVHLLMTQKFCFENQFTGVTLFRRNQSLNFCYKSFR